MSRHGMKHRRRSMRRQAKSCRGACRRVGVGRVDGLSPRALRAPRLRLRPLPLRLLLRGGAADGAVCGAGAGGGGAVGGADAVTRRCRRRLFTAAGDATWPSHSPARLHVASMTTSSIARLIATAGPSANTPGIGRERATRTYAWVFIVLTSWVSRTRPFCAAIQGTSGSVRPDRPTS
jgi:hypothetical protein